MRKPLVFGICLLLFPARSPAHRRPVRHPGAIPNPRSVLWIGAHPDAEAAAAPLLSLWCREQRAKCTFLSILRRPVSGCGQ